LFQAQKLQSIGLVAGGIAHDFGHSLTSIKSCANLILKENAGANKDLTEYAQNIFNVCTMIGESSRKLLDFARRNRPDMSPVSVHEVVESMVHLLGFMLDKKIVIHADLQAGDCMVMGNFAQLQNALMNLALNASDAMQDGGTLTFSTGNREDQPGEKTGTGDSASWLSLCVADTGSGMDEETKKNLFSPFFTTKGPEKGTGLGMSIVKRVVDAHCGTISIASEKGKGTMVTMLLPVMKI
jgi:polar amino acid transport system substrate-binding protein